MRRRACALLFVRAMRSRHFAPFLGLALAACSGEGASSSPSSPDGPDAGADGAPSMDGGAMPGSDGGVAPPPDAGTPSDAAAPSGFWDAGTIPAAHNVMTFVFLNRTNGKFKDSEVYWSFKSGAISETHSIADA